MSWSCRGRGVCPACNARRMAKTAAHRVDRVVPPVPVGQWVIYVLKRLRCLLADRPEAECPACGGDIRFRGDGRQETAHFEPEVRKRAKARMASPS